MAVPRQRECWTVNPCEQTSRNVWPSWNSTAASVATRPSAQPGGWSRRAIDCTELRMARESTAERPQAPADSRETAGQGHGRKSKAVREQAILALLSERTMARAAERCGVNERTLRRWLTADATFKAEYEAARSALYEAGMSRIQALTGRAVDTLEDLLGAKEHPAVRLGAA